MSEEQKNAPTLVRDLMSVGVPTCAPELPLLELTKLFLEKELEAIVVLDERGHAIGVVSREDLVRIYATGEWSDLMAADAMQDGVPEVPPDIPLTAAAQIMQDQNVRALFMMHHAGGIAYPAAMLTYKHFLRHLAAEDETVLSDLGIEAEREPPLQAFYRRRDEARRKAGPRR